MSIEGIVRDSLRHFQEKNFLAAMTSACIALDATGKKEFQTSSENRCKQLVQANMDIITHVSFSGAFFSVPGAKISLSRPESKNTPIPIEDIIYKSIRCNLIHEASLPPGVEFTEEPMYGERSGIFYLPVVMILALLLVVIGSPTNATRNLKVPIFMCIRDVKLDLNSLWGKAAEIRRLLKIDELSNPPRQDGSA